MNNREPSDREIRELFESQNARHTEMTAAIAGENLRGYPIAGINIMDHAQLNRLAARNGMKDPDYVRDPIAVYTRVQHEIGADMLDQWIPDNPLTMSEHGLTGETRTATTGIETIVVDGMTIREPEDVVAHLETVEFPRLEKQLADFDKEKRVREIGLTEYRLQHEMGLDILKTGYDIVRFPILGYYTYGYVNYLCAYALYEDVMERHFKLQAELCRKNNEAAAEAYNRYSLPLLCRLDFDMTDSRSTLVNIRSLNRIWYPQLDYCLQPVLNGCDVRLIWHCDGAISSMVPGLIDVGIRGFQGFQYEDGVDFAGMCKLRGNDGRPLFMLAGASVTRTLPFKTPADVRAELDWLVDVHGDTALVLGCSSSMAPGVSSENVDALLAGLKYYQTHRK
ncbi:MAG: hypothetical protein KIG36_03235 [Eubacteriales bacterium]|nr:hypothetical protein [Eubacteriales bacterium]